MKKKILKGLVPGSALLGLLMGAPGALVYAQGQSGGGGSAIIEAGQPPVVLHATVDQMTRLRGNNGNANGSGNGHGPGGGTASVNLTYHGGVGGVGVETTPKIYLVLWGAQWTNNDHDGEEAILTAFYKNVGGSSWLNSVTQYCQGVATGTTFCNGGGQAATNPGGILVGIWHDNGSAAPARPKQADLAGEAVKAAQYFGNQTADSNASVQYVIATASGNSATGFGTQYCAYHSSTSSTYGNVAYTNLPYMTDAGASCGAGFNGLGPKAGITIVGGHEMGETITDQFPNGGWLDAQGEENGDKCAWIQSGQGASAFVTLADGSSIPVQSLWSNAFNGGAGGCVLSN